MNNNEPTLIIKEDKKATTIGFQYAENHQSIIYLWKNEDDGITSYKPPIMPSIEMMVYKGENGYVQKGSISLNKEAIDALIEKLKEMKGKL